MRNLTGLFFCFQYLQLVTDIKNFTSSLTSADNVQSLVQKLHKVIDKPARKNVTSTFTEVDLWQKSQEKFVDMIEAEYSMYRDLTVPFICALQQVGLGHTMI